MAASDAARPLTTTIKQFFDLARTAELFVGGDTGPLHVAAAAGAKIVGIYGPTSTRRNGPFDANDITVARDLWCRPDCHRRKCWHWECLRIPFEVVADAARRRVDTSTEETPNSR
jgi:ADP-heptose:LPS heptosyltransferase